MKRIVPACLVTGVMAASAAGLGAACSSTDGPTAPPISGECQGPSCLPVSDAGVPETSTKKDAEAGASETGPDAELVSQEGRLFFMAEPLFEPFLSASTAYLTAPARVSVGAYGSVYSADSDHDGGFKLVNVPKVEGAPMMIEDIDGKAGVISTLWPTNIPSQTGTFDIAVLPRAPIESILSTVTPPITLDPNKGHMLVTMINSVLDPTGTAFAHLQPSRPAEAVIYLTSTKSWVRDDPSGTSNTGVALVVNMDAAPFPGEVIRLKYTVSGQSGVMAIPFDLKLAAGTINRVYFYASSAVQE